MLASLLPLLAILAVLMVITGVVAAAFLAAGTVLALVFAVTVWQATVIVMAAAFGVVSLLRVLQLPADEPFDELDDSVIETVPPDFSWRRLRRGKKRKR